jgi:hypothetical protein
MSSMWRDERISRRSDWPCVRAIGKGELAGNPLIVRPIHWCFQRAARPFVGVLHRK